MEPQPVTPTFYLLNKIPGFTDLLLNDTGTLEETNNEVKETKYLIKKDMTTKNNNKYSIIQYDKTMLAVDLIQTVGLARSVIVNGEKKVVGFSPPKSIPYDNFVSLYPEKTDDIIVEEFIEGTMINVFWDNPNGFLGNWEISTRNRVGGECTFYKNQKSSKTFRDMFFEAVTHCGLDFSKLNPLYCYSFVLQHPENRIVGVFDKPSIYFIETYEICSTENGTVAVYPFHKMNYETERFFWESNGVKLPKILSDWTTYNDIKPQYINNVAYHVQGVVIRNRVTNERTKIRNPDYEYVRRLKGNQPKTQYQYLCLRQHGKVGEYLAFYPENKKEFSRVRDRLHEFTELLFQNYIQCYMKKMKPLKDFPDNVRTHMFHLHKIYLEDLKPRGFYITNTDVIKYVNKLHPTLQMYSMNYSARRRRIDILKSEVNQSNSWD
jgi:hypothetical protein